MIQDALSTVETLHATVDALNEVVEAEAHFARAAAEIADELSVEQSQLVYTVEMQAQDKTGPLAGLAKTSKAYGAALDVLWAKECSNGGAAGKLTAKLKQAQRDLDDAKVERQQLQNKLSALRHVSDLQTAILNALGGA